MLEPIKGMTEQNKTVTSLVKSLEKTIEFEKFLMQNYEPELV